jgi:site-specific recombinase XerD
MRRLWSKTQATFPQLNDAVLYCCRHTFGTELYRKSRDIKLVKDMMGHKNISTTEIYVHVVGNEHSDIVADLMSRRQPVLAEVSVAGR